MLDHDHWEDLFPSLQNELATISAFVRLDARISKNNASPWAMRASIDLERFAASVPAIPNVKLAQPISLSYVDKKLQI